MISRRGFVGAAAGLATAGRLKAAGSPLDVVVVGGGVSGAAASAQLTSQGHQVVMLEARSRLGGRINYRLGCLMDSRTFPSQPAGRPGRQGGNHHGGDPG